MGIVQAVVVYTGSWSYICVCGLGDRFFRKSDEDEDKRLKD